MLSDRDQERLRVQQEKFAASQVSSLGAFKETVLTKDMVQTPRYRNAQSVPYGLGTLEHYCTWLAGAGWR